MENFTPLWDIKSETNVIQEGNDVLLTISINKDPKEQSDLYTLKDDEHIEFELQIETKNLNGTDFVAENHFTLFTGEKTDQMIDIISGITQNKKIKGNHVVSLSSKEFQVVNDTLAVWYFKLHCIQNETYNGTEIVTFNLVDARKVSPSNNTVLGTVRTEVQDITYDSTEFWVTPGVEVGDGHDPYCIGDITFGSDSTLFVQAFGRKRPYDPKLDSIPDPAPRVYYPIYRLMAISRSELPSTDITQNRAIILPQNTNFPIGGLNKEVKVNIQDSTQKNYDTGLVFNPNGQFLQAFLYDSDPTDAYFKVQIQDIEASYINDNERFNVGQRFKSGQMFLCPNVFDYASPNGKAQANHLYQLKSGVTYPYVINSALDDGINKPLFDNNDWIDLGFYDKRLGNDLIGQTKIFRVLVNSGTSGKIGFITDSDLGTIHVGEYFGHSVYPRIESDSVLNTSFHIVGGDDITKYGLELRPDGYLTGTAYAKSNDFTANDDIPLSFEVEVFDTSGLRNTQEFKLRILRGFGENYISSHLVPSVQFERDWFKCISTQSFVEQPLYRVTDPRYGLQKVPRILLKENFISQDYNYTTLQDLKRVLRKNIIDPSGTNIPQGTFKMVIGNYKIMSCVDNLGNLQYDLLYREVHPEGTMVSVSNKPRTYSVKDYTVLTEVFGLRENIFKAVGEDTTNLITYPEDLMNRGLYVQGINGYSTEMLDTVPRFMNHPYEEDNIKPAFMIIIPVAYCLPGKAEAFFTKLMQNNEHKSMVSTEFEISAVEFMTHINYVKEKFQIILQKP